MKDLRVINGRRRYILELIAEGEHERQDFKYAISDARKIARSISAFANRHGGSLLIGVKDNGNIAGVRNEEDIYVVEQAAQMYCDPPQDVEFTAYSTGDTGIVIRAVVAQSPLRPVRAQDHDHTWHAYYRVADENICAHPLMVRAWQRQNAGFRECYRLGGVESAILALLDSQAALTPEQLLLSLPASKRSVHAAIVKMAAMGLIEFEHQPAGFVLKTASLEEEDV